ncbi:mitochondrial coenzyme A diphosphatase NUDT8 [Daktulosphaira vitifoliae]|uniref:mitochondrial coenzyme A diphosphatase NUDT8 n=1 Tax=Daktulosphaira vitifoliae TaxID=58002 RepID=UPI0021AA258B|nr:mitochondrial coenzyme A diphosphatase NUDT8 [Daktulosphaira vitifoliae]
MHKILRKKIPIYSRFFSVSSVSKCLNLDSKIFISKEQSVDYVKSFVSMCPEGKIENKRQAAVLIPLCYVNNELSLLYTLRTNNLKRNSGQVSFPGGMKEDNEDLRLTALRETCEELGINDNNVEIWGHGKFLLSRDIAIMPFLGNLGNINPKKLNVSHKEVQYAFSLPLKHFCEPSNCKYTCFKQKYNRLIVLPVYLNEYKRIWGMTGYMTWLALCSILPNKFKHRLLTPITVN